MKTSGLRLLGPANGTKGLDPQLRGKIVAASVDVLFHGKRNFLGRKNLESNVLERVNFLGRRNFLKRRNSSGFCRDVGV
jgi:hypothetical protein